MGRVHDLATRAAYARCAGGRPVKRHWLKWFDQVTQPRRTAIKQAEQHLWDGPLGELAWQHEEARRAAELADRHQTYELDQPAISCRQTAEAMLDLHIETPRADHEADRVAARIFALREAGRDARQKEERHVNSSAEWLHGAAAGWPEPGTPVPEPVPGTWTGTPAWWDFATESGAMPDHQDPSSERSAQTQAGTEAGPAQVASGQAWDEYLAAQATAGAAQALSSDLSTDAGLEAYLLSNEADAAYDEYAAAWVRENYSQAELDAIEAQNRAEGWELGQ